MTKARWIVQRNDVYMGTFSNLPDAMNFIHIQKEKDDGQWIIENEWQEDDFMCGGWCFRENQIITKSVDVTN